jgi:hypothetical protein
MELVYVLALIVIAVFITWLATRYIYTHRTAEYFAQNLYPIDGEVNGYMWRFGDPCPDTFKFFGFNDSLQSAFSTYLLPHKIPRDPQRRRYK